MTPPDLDKPWWLHPNLTLPLAIGIWCCLGGIGAYLPLVADEAYYLAWSQRLTVGYFDHPPMVAYVIAIFGHMPRLASWCICGASVALLTLSAKTLELRYWYALPLLYLCTPLGIASALITTPDTPLLFACSLLIYGLVSDRKIYVWAALCFGLWSKPTAILLFPAIWFTYPRKWSIMLTVGAFAAYLPHVFWSMDNGGLPWSFQSQRPFSMGWSSIVQLLELFGTQAILVGPLMCISFWQLIRRRSPSSTRLYLALTLPTCAISVFGSLGMRIEGNWPMLMWPPVLLLALNHFEQSQHSPWIRWQGTFMLVTLFTVAGITIGERHIPVTVGPDRDGHRLSSCLRRHFPTQRILTTRYQEAALLLLDSPNVHVLHTPATRRSQFDLWKTHIRPIAECNDIILGMSDRCPEIEVDYEYCGQQVYECICRHYP